MKLTFRAGDPVSNSKQAAVFLVSEGKIASGPLKEINKALGNALTRIAKTGEFTGKNNTSITLPTYGALKTERLILVGIGGGSPDGIGAYVAGHKVTLAMKAARVTKASVDTGFAYELQKQFLLGALNTDYSYSLKSEKPKAGSLELILSGRASKKDTALMQEVGAINAGVALTKDLVSGPANVVTPRVLARTAQEIAKRHAKVRAKVFGMSDLKKMKMGGIIGVGKGSKEEPRLAIVEYKGGPASLKPIVLVGKGLTFDAGGISLKPGPGMESMKYDMGGGGAVFGAMEAIAGAKYKVNVIGIVGCAENMPDGAAYKPSDVLTMASGKTVEVLNTDAEGRLVLADCLDYACKTYEPKMLLDLATLTGACAMLLGDQAAGLFTCDDKLAGTLLKASDSQFDKLWQLPLFDHHKDAVKSDIADLKNISSGRKAGASTAAGFLSYFVDDKVSWAHLDIAGMAWNDGPLPGRCKGASGYGPQLLASLAKAHAR